MDLCKQALTSLDFKDLQPVSVDVDVTGQFALLTSRRCVAVLDLLNTSNLKKFCRNYRWDSRCVCQWSPHNQNFLVTNNQNLELFEWSSGNSKLLCSISAHSRIISDVDWSQNEPNVVVSSADNDYIYIWDLRDHRKPKQAIQSYATTSQAKWCKKAAHVLASSQDGDIRIWDTRYQKSGVHPGLTSHAVGHLSKINSLDWDPNSPNKILSAGLDGTLKIWNVNDMRNNETEGTAGPIWKARFLPHHDVIVSIPVAQRFTNTNDSILLWNPKDLGRPPALLSSQADSLMDFAFQKDDDDEFKLVTIGRDWRMKTWSLSNLNVSESFENGSTTPLGVPAVDALADEFSTAVNLSSPDHTRYPVMGNDFSRGSSSFQQELMTLRKLRVPNLSIERVDPVRGFAGVSFTSRKHVIQLSLAAAAVAAPATTNNDNFDGGKDPPKSGVVDESLKTAVASVPLSIQFNEGSTLSMEAKDTLIRQLEDIYYNQAYRNNSRLELCLKSLPKLVEQLESCDTLESPGYGRQSFLGTSQYSAHDIQNQTYQDSKIPFPRMSGARFSGSGRLVCFGRLLFSDQAHVITDKIPRAMSALTSYKKTPHDPSGLRGLKPTPSPETSAEYQFTAERYYNKERAHSLKRRPKRDTLPQRFVRVDRALPEFSIVHVYDADSLLIMNRDLARNYVCGVSDRFPTQEDVCNQNVQVAMAAGRPDLVQLWSVLSHVTSAKLKPKLNPNLETPWAVHPFGRPLIYRYIEHYVKHRDWQTVAMITTIVCEKSPYLHFPERYTFSSHHRFRIASSSESDSCETDSFHIVDNAKGPKGNMASQYSTVCGTGTTAPNYKSDNESIASLSTSNRQRSNSLDDEAPSGTGLKPCRSETQNVAPASPTGSTSSSVFQQIRQSIPNSPLTASPFSNHYRTLKNAALQQQNRAENHLRAQSPGLDDTSSELTLTVSGEYGNIDAINQQQQHSAPQHKISSGYPPFPPALAGLNPRDYPVKKGAEVKVTPSLSLTNPFGSGGALYALGQPGGGPDPNTSIEFGSVSSTASASFISADDNATVILPERTEKHEQDIHDDLCKLISPSIRENLESVRSVYASILHAWRLLLERTDLMKYSPPSLEHAMDFMFAIRFTSCCESPIFSPSHSPRVPVTLSNRRGERHTLYESAEPAAHAFTDDSSLAVKNTAHCYRCSKSTVSCSVCQIGVKTQVTLCPSCGHGGHLEHLQEWFETESRCAVAICTCNCTLTTFL